MKVVYRLLGVGSAECMIKIGEDRYTFYAGDVTNALGDILFALLRVNPLYPDGKYSPENNSATFRWDGEPEETEWGFRLIEGDRLLVTINHDHKIKLKTECSYQAFLEDILASAEQILEEYGILGFSEMWYGYGFPIESYLKLKYSQKHMSAFPLAEEDKSFKSDLTTEFKLLKEILKDDGSCEDLGK
ncbi:hypothetical protein [Caldalkalibacillus salinus]|uniref:hypothetical protein n=1 Tax=Caldalkalibacillus salinus TaxID=2803787 RepID=UPI001920C403|nr:hypothetical protein [Caldalkalibacillus salinus]